MQLGFIGRNDLAGAEADAKFAAHHGFRGLEFNFWADFADVTETHMRHIQEILQRHNVACSALGLWGWNHLAPDPQERAYAQEMLRRALEFASVLQAPVLITGGGHIPGASLSEHVKEFVEVFSSVLEQMAGRGQRAAFYALHGQSFFNSLSAYEAVWEHLSPALVGIKYDPANWQHAGQDYLEVVRRHGDKIAHVHIKEHLLHKGEIASQPAAGMGDIAFGKILAFLYEYDYRGYLSLEPHGPLWGKEPLRQKMLLLSRKHLEPFLL